MATERRPYHRAADAIWDEPWPDSVVAGHSRLSAYLHSRWRTDRLDARTMFPLRISWRTMAKLVGGNSVAATTARLHVLGTYLGTSWVPAGHECHFSWPKWPQFQGLIPVIGRNSSPSASSVPRPASYSSLAPPSISIQALSTPLAGGSTAHPAGNGSEPGPGPATRADGRNWKAEVRAIWPECVEAARRYGRRWDTLSESRLVSMASRLRDSKEPPEVLVRAIHGAWAQWTNRRKESADFDPLKYLVPETVYRAANFTKYAEAGTVPVKPIFKDTEVTF